jgi:hypothetical protein
MKKHSINDVEKAFEQSVGHMIRSVDEFPWENEAAYAQWCAQTYYLVRHTTRFLNLSAGSMTIDQENFHQFYLSHLREETGHEMLAYRDLESLGWKIEDAPETMEAQLMLQSQYYWLFTNPLAHFGFFWCLEKMSVERGLQAIERIRKTHGPECHTFLDLHSADDVQHVINIQERIKDIPQDQYGFIIRNIEQTGILYAKMLREIAAKYDAVKTRKAA